MAINNDPIDPIPRAGGIDVNNEVQVELILRQQTYTIDLLREKVRKQEEDNCGLQSDIEHREFIITILADLLDRATNVLVDGPIEKTALDVASAIQRKRDNRVMRRVEVNLGGGESEYSYDDGEE